MNIIKLRKLKKTSKFRKKWYGIDNKIENTTNFSDEFTHENLHNIELDK